MKISTLKKTSVQKLQDSGIPFNEAELEVAILMKHVFAIDRKDLLLNPDKEIEEREAEKFNLLIKRRINEGVPVQYLTNTAYFMGGEFYVDENVLIPRPETEILVEEVIKRCDECAKIIDIGTGSGCIAIMLAKKLPKAQVTAVDISPKALEVAKINARKLGVADRIQFVHSDIFATLENTPLFQGAKFDIVVSNPPYIPAKEKQNLQREVALHEPELALFVEDEEGVSFYRELAAQAGKHLNPGGLIAVEVGFSQAELVVKVFVESGFADICTINDLSGIGRVVVGRQR